MRGPAVLLCAVLLGFASASSDAPVKVPLEYRLRLVEVINRDRSAAGLSAVEFSADLSRAADAHCLEMLREDYTSHWNRDGWKPYLRYAAAGIRDATAENIASFGQNDFPADLEATWGEMLAGHRRFMAEKPPSDGHRQNVLNPQHTHVGIGVAAASKGVRMMEVFAARYAQLEPLPLRARLRDALGVRGRIASRKVQFFALSVFYEPLPRPMTLLDLAATSSYGLPDEEQVHRPRLENMLYTDGTRGTVAVEPTGHFHAPLSFWKGRPGVYTVLVWVRRPGGKPFPGAMTSLLVEQ